MPKRVQQQRLLDTPLSKGPTEGNITHVRFIDEYYSTHAAHFKTAEYIKFLKTLLVQVSICLLPGMKVSH